MCTPAPTSLSIVSAAVMLVVCSLVVAPPAHSQDSSLPPTAGSASMQLAPEVEISLAEYEANLKAAIKTNDPKSQALAFDRIGALYFTHRNPAEALEYF